MRWTFKTDNMRSMKKLIPLAIILISAIIGVSECIRIRTRYVRYVRYTSGYSSGSGSSSLSAGVIAAIVVGSIATPIIFTVCIICCVVCCKKKEEQRNAQARQVVVFTRSPQVISTVQATNRQYPNSKYPQANDQQFTNQSFSMEPPKYNDLTHTNSK